MPVIWYNINEFTESFFCWCQTFGNLTHVSKIYIIDFAFSTSDTLYTKVTV